MNINETIDKYLGEAIFAIPNVEIMEIFFDYYSDDDEYDKSNNTKEAEKVIIREIEKIYKTSTTKSLKGIKSIITKWSKTKQKSKHLNKFQKMLTDKGGNDYLEDVANAIQDKNSD